MSARLILQRHPIDPSSRTFEEVPAGARLGALLAERTPPQLRERHTWTARANGAILGPEALEAYELREGDLVTCRVRPRAPIALGAAILSAVGVGGTTAAGAFAIAGSVALGTGAAFIVGTVVLTGVNLLISKLLGPKAPSQTRASGGAAPFYSLSGSRNELRRGGAFQTHFGTMRVVPDLLLPPVSRVDANGVVSVKYVFVVGKGEYELADLKLRDTLLTEFDPTVQIYDGSGSQLPSEALDRFTTNVNELSVNTELLDKIGGSERIVNTTAQVCTSFTVVSVFSRGIWGIDKKGRPRKVSVRLHIEYRAAGSSDPWTVLHSVEESAYVKKPIVRNISSGPLEPGQYDVAIELRQVNSNGSYMKERGGREAAVSARISDLSWLSLQSQVPGAPFDDAGLADLCIFGVDLRASEILNGALDQVNVLATRKLPTFDGSAWTAPVATASPAWAFAFPLRERDGDDEIESAELLRFDDYCAEQGWEFHHTFNEAGSVSVGEAVSMAAAAGQASYVRKGALHSIALDELKSTPVAIFTGDKIQALTITRTFLDPLHAVRVSFINAEAGYQIDELTVYLPGYGPDNATEFQVLELVPGIVYAEQLQRHILRELARRRLRNRVFSFKDAYYDGLTVFKGDMIELAHGRALLGLAETRVVQYTTQLAGSPPEDCLDELELARPVTMEAGRTYSLRVAKSTGELLTIPLVNPLTAGRQDYYTVSAAGAVPVPTYEDDAEDEIVDELEDAVASFGELGTETVELLVTGLEYDENLLATFTATTYSPEVQTADSVPFPAHVSITGRIVGDRDSQPPPPALGTPRAVFRGLSEHGEPLLDVILPLRPGTDGTDGAPTATFRLQWRLRLNDAAPEEWHTEPPIEAATAAELVVPGLEGAQTIDLRVFAASRFGVLSAPAQVSTFETIGTVAAPQDVTVETDVTLDAVAGARTVVTLAWRYEDPDPRPDTVVRYRKDFGEWIPGATVVENFLQLFALEPGEYEFELRGRLFGEVSDPTTVGATVFAPGAVPSTARPSGLELLVAGVRGGNSREFVGRSVTFVWNPLSYDGSLQDGYTGLDEAPPDALLDGWVARILDPTTGALVREERPEAAASSYTYAHDVHLEDGLRRSLRFELRVRDRLGNLSAPAVLVASNPAPVAPGSLVIEAAPGAVFVSFDLPTDPDLAGVLVWADDSPGFTPGPSNLVGDNPLTPTGSSSVSFFWTEGTTAYFRLAFYDAFGKELADLDLSDEFDADVPFAAIEAGSVSDAALDADLRRGLSVAYSNGFEVSADVDDIVVPSGSGTVAPSADAFSGSLSALFTWNGAAPSDTSDAGAPYLVLPERTALAISGQRVRVQVYAKRPSSNPSTQFRIALDVGAGSSGWQEFTSTTSWAPYSFLYTVPAITNAAALRLRIQGDSDGGSEAGSGQGVLIDSIAIFPLLEQITSSNASTHLGTGAIGPTPLATDAVTAAKIAAAAVTNAKIDTDAVTTVKVADGSITTNGAAFTGGTEDISTTYEDLASVTITAHGSPVVVQCYLEATRIGSDVTGLTAKFKILRDGTTVAETSDVAMNATAGRVTTYAFAAVDTPSSGSRTYKIQGKCTGGAAGGNHITTSNRSIVVTELRK